ncbi:hypothetical protein ACFSUS_08485 [Spirosoma soli]|uniref:DUF2029 domain-containing protein n=1 Tax=Spirosoma soli TaxID=1770529 RepID=A0ABW5M0T8_9BACT
MISFEATSLVKVAMALGLAMAVLLVFYNRERLKPVFQRHETTTIYLTFLLLRLLPFVAVYVVMNQDPRSDVDFFYRKAQAALQGKLVYRDFLSYHAPLFGYFISLPLLIWYSAKSIVLLMAVAEFIIARATVRYYRNRMNGAIVWYVLYYLLPLPFVAMILSSEEDLWMWGFGLITLALPETRRFSLWVGVIWGIGMLTIKFMLVVFLIPLFFIVPNRLQYVAGLLLVGLPSLVILYALVGMDFLMPIQHSSLPMTPNVVSVLRPFFGIYFDRVPLTYLNWCGLLTTIGGASFIGHRFRTMGYRQLMPLLYVFTFALFMVCLPSSPGYYLFTYTLPLVFVVLSVDNRPRVWIAFTLLNILTIAQPILSVLYNGQELYNTWALINRPTEWVDYVIQCVELGILLYLLRTILKQFHLAAGQEQLAEPSLSAPLV